MCLEWNSKNLGGTMTIPEETGTTMTLMAVPSNAGLLPVTSTTMTTMEGGTSFTTGLRGGMIPMSDPLTMSVTRLTIPLLPGTLLAETEVPFQTDTLQHQHQHQRRKSEVGPAQFHPV